MLLSDSMAKYVDNVSDLEVICYPGINFERLTFKVQNSHSLQSKILSVDFLIIHVGTNNIHRLSSLEFPAALNSLFSAIRSVNPHVKLLYSAILPRPVDFNVSERLVIQANNRMMRFCKSRKIPFISTFRPFVSKSGQVHRHMFAIRDGGLHLNNEGSRVLSNFFLQVVKGLRAS